MPQKKYHHHSGFSIVEVMLGIGLLGILIGVSTMLLKNYQENTLKAIASGGDEDIRQYLRMNFDCKQTVLREKNTCKTGGLIRGYNSVGTPLMASASAGIDFNGVNVRINCSNDGLSIVVAPEAKEKGASTYKELFRVPLACKICGVDITSTTMTFPPPPIPKTPGNLMSFLNKTLVDCGEPSLGSQPIVRATGTSTRGKDKPFQMGTPHLPTLKKVCDAMGFDTYVSSTCAEERKDTRCNFTSPGDNWLWYWNGTHWARRGSPIYNHSWLSSITCSDPR